MRIRWYGLDFGETMMNPFTLHQSVLIRRIYEDLGRPEEAEERIQKWYRLRNSFGSPADPTDVRVRHVKQYERSRIYSEVLDNDAEAVRRFEEGESAGFTAAKGVEPALSRLKENETVPSIVSESAERTAVLAITRFLNTHGMKGLIDEIITPAGRFDTDGTLTSSEFVGKTKREGTIYEELKAYLSRRGISSEEAAIMGDDPTLDVKNAKLHGFVTIYYTGIINRGPAPMADYVVDDWSRILFRP